MNETNTAPLAYWRCHSELPQSLMIASSTVTAMLTLLVVNAAFGMSYNFSHASLGRMFNKAEKRAIFAQYIFAMPLFEVFVIWTPVGIAPNSTSSVVSWLVINSLSVALVIVSIFSLQRYRWFVHVAQSMRAPTAIMFFCDRIINFSIGVEGVFIGAVFACSLFELFHVHRFNVQKPPKVSPVDMPPDPPIVREPTTPTHRTELRQHDAEEEVVRKPAETYEFDETVPLSVQHQLLAKVRHKKAAAALSSLSNLKGNESARTIQRLVAPLRRHEVGTSVSSGSMSDRASLPPSSAAPAGAEDESALSSF
jgi:hypothetical protein